jgi:spore germination protein KA
MNFIKWLTVYQKPSDTKTFELLESSGESGDNEKDIPSGSNQMQENTSGNKSPMPIDIWNKTRNEKKASQGQIDNNSISKSLEVNNERIKKEFNIPKNQDAIIKEFNIGSKIKAFIVFTEGMVDRNIINNCILRQLMNPESFREYTDGCTIDYIINNVLSVHETYKIKDYDKTISNILNGMTALFIDGCDECLIIESRGYEKRNVEKPVTETVVRGSQEGFNENMRTNITLIRKIIRNKNLVTEILPVGKTNNSSCAILYIDGLTNPQIVNEVIRRINEIDVDFVSGDGMLEQLIEDNPFMLIPQVLNTERPDSAASYIMQGQVAIVSEGSPFVSIVPITFFSLFHTPEDTNMRWQWGSVLRLIRIISFFTALLTPGLYAAITLYHQEMIPTELLSAIVRSREYVPFPTVIELIIMEFSFELIREAGIRIPGVIGTTIGIIGALILGQAAVTADIVSPIMIIIVAITGLSNFSMPNYSLATSVRILRFVFIFFGAIAGFYGIAVAMFIIGGFACSMKSFGAPFLVPVAPKTKSSRDLIIRRPIWNQILRPDAANTLNRKRAGDSPNWWIKNKRGGGNI